MLSNKKLLAASHLYLILDAQVLSYAHLLKVLKVAVREGVDIVQLRDKNGSAKDILSFCRHALKITRHQVPFLVNDRLDLAMLAGADGLHVGQEDIGYAEARRWMGPRKIIGVSCQSFKHAEFAEASRVDYIGFGSIFKTATKPERNPMNLKVLRRVLNIIRVPVFAIGGISRDNVAMLAGQGVSRVAVCRDILLAGDVAQAINKFKQILD